MFVGTVEIHEEVSQGGQGGESGGRTVDELPVGTCGCERSPQHEKPLQTGVETVVGQQSVDGPLGMPCGEHGLHRTQVGPGTNGAAIGAFAEDQLDRAEDDGFARTGFSRDDVESRMEFQGQIGDECEIADAQRGEHDPSWRSVDRVEADGNDGVGRNDVGFVDGSEGCVSSGGR